MFSRVSFLFYIFEMWSGSTGDTNAIDGRAREKRREKMEMIRKRSLDRRGHREIPFWEFLVSNFYRFFTSQTAVRRLVATYSPRKMKSVSKVNYRTSAKYAVMCAVTTVCIVICMVSRMNCNFTVYFNFCVTFVPSKATKMDIYCRISTK